MAQSSVLCDEIVLLKDLLSLAEEKKQAIMANNWDKLQKITETEETAVKRLSAMEETRKKQAGSFSNEETELHRLAEELKAKNELNQMLLNDALAYTRFLLNTVMGVMSTPPTYGAEGTLQGTSYRQLIDGRG